MKLPTFDDLFPLLGHFYLNMYKINDRIEGLFLLWTPKLLQDRHPTNFAFLKGARIFQHFSFSWLTYHETAHGNYKVTWKKFKKCDDFKGLCLPRRRAFDSSRVQPLRGRILLLNLNNFLRTYGLWCSPMFDLIMFILMLVNYENKFNLPLPSLRFDLCAQATWYKNRYLSAFFLACVASVSNRVIARKLERKRKKKLAFFPRCIPCNYVRVLCVWVLCVYVHAQRAMTAPQSWLFSQAYTYNPVTWERGPF